MFFTCKEKRRIKNTSNAPGIRRHGSTNHNRALHTNYKPCSLWRNVDRATGNRNRERDFPLLRKLYWRRPLVEWTRRTRNEPPLPKDSVRWWTIRRITSSTRRSNRDTTRRATGTPWCSVARRLWWAVRHQQAVCRTLQHIWYMYISRLYRHDIMIGCVECVCSDARREKRDNSQ